MFLFSSSGFLILAFSLCGILDSSLCKISQDAQEWMCADENCSEPIAEAVVTKPYTPNDPRKILARKGDKLKILRQVPPDSKQKLVYVESLVLKKKGLLHVNYILEKKVLIKNDDLVRTHLGLPGYEPPTPDISPSDINPSAPTTVIDGTTITEDYGYPSPYASYEPTQAPGGPSESVVQSTTPPSIPAGDPDSGDPKDNEVESGHASEKPGTTHDISLGEKSDRTSVPSGDENAQDVEDLGISSTPASSIANAEPSLAPKVPQEADIVMSTTEIPSPSQESEEMDLSRKVSDSPAQPDLGKSGSAEETLEGSGSPDNTVASGVWSGLTSMFSSSSGSGEVEEAQIETLADSNKSDEPSLRRGPSPSMEQDASGFEKLVEEISETAELKPSDSIDQASTDSKSKRSLSDSSEFPGDAKSLDTTEKKEELPKSEQGSIDASTPEQGPTVSTRSEQDPEKLTYLNPGLHDKLSNASSQNEVDPEAYPNVEQDTGTAVDPDVTTKIAEQDTENTLDTSSEGNPILESPGTTKEPTEDSTTTGNDFDLNRVHTQETRVSMSSSYIADTIGQVESREDVPTQDLHSQSTEVTVETEDNSAEDINSTAVNGQVLGSPDPVEQRSEIHSTISNGITSSPTESETSNVGADHLDESGHTVSKTENPNVEEAQAGVEEMPNDDLESVSPPSVKVPVQQVSAPEEVASVSPPDESKEKKSSGLSDLSFASPMEFVDPRKTNPDLYSSDVPITEKPVADTPNQWTASVEEVPLYKPWPSTPEQSLPLEDPVPTVQPSLAEQPAAPDASPEPHLDSDVAPAPSDLGSLAPPSFQEPDLSEDSSEPWYSGIFSMFGGLQDMVSGSSPEYEVPDHPAESLVTPQTVQVDQQAQTCQTDSCGAEEKTFDVGSSILGYYESIPVKTVILMVVTAGAVLIFSLGYYFLENQQRDVELVSKYNELVGKLFIEQKEKETLLEQLATANESMTQISFDTTKFDDQIRDLKALVQKYKEEKAAIEEKEKEANRRRIISDKNYNDLLKTFSMHKQKGERSALSAEVKNLKDRIEAGELNIASLKEQLLEKKGEVKSLNAKIVELGETNQESERKAEKAISEVHDNAQKYQESISKLEKTLEENMASLVKLEADCTRLKKEKESLAVEKELAESSLQKFQQLTPANALTEWLDAKEVRVSLLAAEKKLKVLSEENETLVRDKKQLEEKWKSLKVDLDQLNENYEKAEREKIEALTKLQVLSDYFKEKESQLQEELGSKESLWLQKQSDDRTIYEQMRALREENTSFKNQNETLKREILEQEASYKKLIASSNEKADEHWVSLRHTERRLKEAQMEASQLRSRLSTLGATGDNPADKIKGEVNGDLPPFGSATSPQFMLYPHEFVPPPPLPTATPSRPPPLGRISSPPPVDFVPPPPIIPFESLFLPPSPPPPVPHAMMNITHKPQPLDGAHHRTQKDSQSSNHSSESTSDKPRRNKR